MNSWKVILAAMVIFGTGAIAGGLLVTHYRQLHPSSDPTPAVEHGSRPFGIEHEVRNGPELPRPRPPEMLSRQFLKQLDATLKLSPEQREAIQKILTDGQEKNRCLWTNVAPDVQRVMQEVRENIRAQLTPEQCRQFEALMKQQRAARKAQSTNNPPDSAIPANAPPGA